MTKMKARKRAKAKAAEKAKKRSANTDQPDQKAPPGKFDGGVGTIRSPKARIGANNMAGIRRGAARSR